MRVACLLAPHLPVQVAYRIDPSLADAPLIVGGRPWDPGAVLDCCPQAEAAGIRPGTRLSQAEKLCPGARFVPIHADNAIPMARRASVELCRAAHDALAAAAERFTPTVETAGLGLLYAEVSGLERRFSPARHGRRRSTDADARSMSALACHMAREAAEASGLDARVGIGNGKFVAQQAARAARSGHGCAVPPGEERAFLSPLPLSTLPADPEMQRRLHILGVRTLGALAGLPRLAVVRQFGPSAGPIHDLARGVDPRPVHADAPPLALERTRAFNDPLNDRAPLLAHLNRMAAQLAETLGRRGYQAEGMRLRLEEEEGRAHAAGKPVKPPSADAAKLARLAHRLLGEMTPAGPVTVLSLTVYPLRPFHLGASQLTLFTDARDRRHERLHQVLRRLRERFGEMIIVAGSLLRPPSPRPIQVTADPQGLPRALVWRERIHQVDTVYEVWRERRRWWGRPVERDYFRLWTVDGQMHVIFREVRTGRWSLERRHL